MPIKLTPEELTPQEEPVSNVPATMEGVKDVPGFPRWDDIVSDPRWADLPSEDQTTALDKWSDAYLRLRNDRNDWDPFEYNRFRVNTLIRKKQLLGEDLSVDDAKKQIKEEVLWERKAFRPDEDLWKKHQTLDQMQKMLVGQDVQEFLSVPKFIERVQGDGSFLDRMVERQGKRIDLEKEKALITREMGSYDYMTMAQLERMFEGGDGAPAYVPVGMENVINPELLMQPKKVIDAFRKAGRSEREIADTIQTLPQQQTQFAMAALPRLRSVPKFRRFESDNIDLSPSDLLMKWQKENGGMFGNLGEQLKMGIYSGWLNTKSQGWGLVAMMAESDKAFTRMAELEEKVSEIAQTRSSLGGAEFAGSVAEGAVSLGPTIASSFFTGGGSAVVRGSLSLVSKAASKAAAKSAVSSVARRSYRGISLRAISANRALSKGQWNDFMNLAGMGVASGAQSAGGQFYGAYTHYKDVLERHNNLLPEGSRLTPEQIEEQARSMGIQDAWRSAAVTGAITLAFGYGGSERANKLVGKALNPKAPTAAEVEAAKRTFKTKVWDFLREDVGGEFIEEAGDEFVNGLFDMVTNDPNATIGSVVANAFEAGKIGATLGGLVGGASRGGEALIDLVSGRRDGTVSQAAGGSQTDQQITQRSQVEEAIAAARAAGDEAGAAALEAGLERAGLSGVTSATSAANQLDDAAREAAETVGVPVLYDQDGETKTGKLVIINGKEFIKPDELDFGVFSPAPTISIDNFSNVRAAEGAAPAPATAEEAAAEPEAAATPDPVAPEAPSVEATSAPPAPDVPGTQATKAAPTGDIMSKAGTPFKNKGSALMALRKRTDLSEDTHEVVKTDSGWVIRSKGTPGPQVTGTPGPQVTGTPAPTQTEAVPAAAPSATTDKELTKPDGSTIQAGDAVSQLNAARARVASIERQQTSGKAGTFKSFDGRFDVPPRAVPALIEQNKQSLEGAVIREDAEDIAKFKAAVEYYEGLANKTPEDGVAIDPKELDAAKQTVAELETLLTENGIDPNSPNLAEPAEQDTEAPAGETTDVPAAQPAPQESEAGGGGTAEAGPTPKQPKVKQPAKKKEAKPDEPTTKDDTGEGDAAPEAAEPTEKEKPKKEKAPFVPPTVGVSTLDKEKAWAETEMPELVEKFLAEGVPAWADLLRVHRLTPRRASMVRQEVLARQRKDTPSQKPPKGTKYLKGTLPFPYAPGVEVVTAGKSRGGARKVASKMDKPYPQFIDAKGRVTNFFTNDPDITAHQIDAGIYVRVPAKLLGKVHPSIVVENGVVVAAVSTDPDLKVISYPGQIAERTRIGVLFGERGRKMAERAREKARGRLQDPTGEAGITLGPDFQLPHENPRGKESRLMARLARRGPNGESEVEAQYLNHIATQAARLIQRGVLSAVSGHGVDLGQIMDAVLFEAALHARKYEYMTTRTLPSQDGTARGAVVYGDNNLDKFREEVARVFEFDVTKARDINALNKIMGLPDKHPLAFDEFGRPDFTKWPSLHTMWDRALKRAYEKMASRITPESYDALVAELNDSFWTDLDEHAAIAARDNDAPSDYALGSKMDVAEKQAALEAIATNRPGEETAASLASPVLTDDQYYASPDDEVAKLEERLLARSQETTNKPLTEQELVEIRTFFGAGITQGASRKLMESFRSTPARAREAIQLGNRWVVAAVEAGVRVDALIGKELMDVLEMGAEKAGVSVNEFMLENTPGEDLRAKQQLLSSVLNPALGFRLGSFGLPSVTSPSRKANLWSRMTKSIAKFFGFDGRLVSNVEILAMLQVDYPHIQFELTNDADSAGIGGSAEGASMYTYGDKVYINLDRLEALLDGMTDQQVYESLETLVFHEDSHNAAVAGLSQGDVVRLVEGMTEADQLAIARHYLGGEAAEADLRKFAGLDEEPGSDAWNTQKYILGHEYLRMTREKILRGATSEQELVFAGKHPGVFKSLFRFFGKMNKVSEDYYRRRQSPTVLRLMKQIEEAHGNMVKAYLDLPAESAADAAEAEEAVAPEDNASTTVDPVAEASPPEQQRATPEERRRRAMHKLLSLLDDLNAHPLFGDPTRNGARLASFVADAIVAAIAATKTNVDKDPMQVVSDVSTMLDLIDQEPGGPKVATAMLREAIRKELGYKMALHNGALAKALTEEERATQEALREVAATTGVRYNNIAEAAQKMTPSEFFKLDGRITQLLIQKGLRRPAAVAESWVAENPDRGAALDALLGAHLNAASTVLFEAEQILKDQGAALPKQVIRAYHSLLTSDSKTAKAAFDRVRRSLDRVASAEPGKQEELLVSPVPLAAFGARGPGSAWKANWEQEEAREAEYTKSIQTWLENPENTEAPDPPAFIYRGVTKTSPDASPEAYSRSPNASGYLHVTPWFSVATKKGTFFGESEDATDVWVFQEDGDWDRRWYRGGALAETPLETSSIDSTRGMGWLELLEKTRALFDTYLQEETDRITAYLEHLENTAPADRAEWVLHSKRYDEAEQKLSRGNEDSVFERAAARAVQDLKRGSFEGDLANALGRWSNFPLEFLPSGFHAETPDLISDTDLEDLILGAAAQLYGMMTSFERAASVDRKGNDVTMSADAEWKLITAERQLGRVLRAIGMTYREFADLVARKEIEVPHRSSLLPWEWELVAALEDPDLLDPNDPAEIVTFIRGKMRGISENPISTSLTRERWDELSAELIGMLYPHITNPSRSDIEMGRDLFSMFWATPAQLQQDLKNRKRDGWLDMTATSLDMMLESGDATKRETGTVDDLKPEFREFFSAVEKEVSEKGVWSARALSYHGDARYQTMLKLLYHAEQNLDAFLEAPSVSAFEVDTQPAGLSGQEIINSLRKMDVNSTLDSEYKAEFAGAVNRLFSTYQLTRENRANLNRLRKEIAAAEASQDVEKAQALRDELRELRLKASGTKDDLQGLYDEVGLAVGRIAATRDLIPTAGVEEMYPGIWATVDPVFNLDPEAGDFGVKVGGLERVTDLFRLERDPETHHITWTMGGLSFVQRPKNPVTVTVPVNKTAGGRTYFTSLHMAASEAAASVGIKREVGSEADEILQAIRDKGYDSIYITEEGSTIGRLILLDPDMRVVSNPTVTSDILPDPNQLLDHLFSGDRLAYSNSGLTPRTQRLLARELEGQADKMLETAASLEAATLTSARLWLEREVGPHTSLAYQRWKDWRAGPKSWHGTNADVRSPLTFSKIGEGEGAVFRGWGLYSAQNQALAEHYRDTITQRKNSRGQKTPTHELVAKGNPQVSDLSAQLEGGLRLPKEFADLVFLGLAEQRDTGDYYSDKFKDLFGSLTHDDILHDQVVSKLRNQIRNQKTLEDAFVLSYLSSAAGEKLDNQSHLEDGFFAAVLGVDPAKMRGARRNKTSNADPRSRSQPLDISTRTEYLENLRLRRKNLDLGFKRTTTQPSMIELAITELVQRLVELAELGETYEALLTDVSATADDIEGAKAALKSKGYAAAGVWKDMARRLGILGHVLPQAVFKKALYDLPLPVNNPIHNLILYQLSPGRPPQVEGGDQYSFDSMYFKGEVLSLTIDRFGLFPEETVNQPSWKNEMKRKVKGLLATPEGGGKTELEKTLEAWAPLLEEAAAEQVRAIDALLEEGVPGLNARLDGAVSSPFQWEKGKGLPKENTGNLYQFRINASPDETFYHDRPFYRQPKAVRQAILSIMGGDPKENLARAKGWDLYEMMAGHLNPESPHSHYAYQKVSTVLAEHGVKLIKFADRSTRGKSESEFSYNYVATTEDAYDILTQNDNDYRAPAGEAYAFVQETKRAVQALAAHRLDLAQKFSVALIRSALPQQTLEEGGGTDFDTVDELVTWVGERAPFVVFDNPIEAADLGKDLPPQIKAEMEDFYEGWVKMDFSKHAPGLLSVQPDVDLVWNHKDPEVRKAFRESFFVISQKVNEDEELKELLRLHAAVSNSKNAIVRGPESGDTVTILHGSRAGEMAEVRSTRMMGNSKVVYVEGEPETPYGLTKVVPFDAETKQTAFDVADQFEKIYDVVRQTPEFRRHNPLQPAPKFKEGNQVAYRRTEPDSDTFDNPDSLDVVTEAMLSATTEWVVSELAPKFAQRVETWGPYAWSQEGYKQVAAAEMGLSGDASDRAVLNAMVDKLTKSKKFDRKEALAALDLLDGIDTPAEFLRSLGSITLEGNTITVPDLSVPDARDAVASLIKAHVQIAFKENTDWEAFRELDSWEYSVVDEATGKNYTATYGEVSSDRPLREVSDNTSFRGLSKNVPLASSFGAKRGVAPQNRRVRVPVFTNTKEKWKVGGVFSAEGLWDPEARQLKDDRDRKVQALLSKIRHDKNLLHDVLRKNFGKNKDSWPLELVSLALGGDYSLTPAQLRDLEATENIATDAAKSAYASSIKDYLTHRLSNPAAAAKTKLDAMSKLTKDLKKIKEDVDKKRELMLQANVAKVQAQQRTALGALPPDVQAQVRSMRAKVKSLSQTMASMGLLSSEMTATLGRNLEVYLFRSYQMFDDPKWVENALHSQDPQFVSLRNKASWWFREVAIRTHADRFYTEARKKKSPISKQDATRMATVFVDNTPATVEEIMQSFMGMAGDDNGLLNIMFGRVSGQIENDMLKHRGDLPPEVRAFMGEYKDPMINYARTVSNVGSFIAQIEFMNRMRKDGLAKGWLWEPKAGQVPPRLADGKTNYVELFPAATDDLRYKPLAGLYGPPAMKQALTTVAAKPTPMLKAWAWATTLAMMSKTAFSIAAIIRNFLSNIIIVMAQGHLNPFRPVKMLRALRDAATVVGADLQDTQGLRWLESAITGTSAAITGRSREAVRRATNSMIERLVELGVIRDTAVGRTMQSILEEGSDKGQLRQLDRVLGRQGFLGQVENLFDSAGDFYSAQDDFWKAFAFFSEFNTIRKIRGGKVNPATGRVYTNRELEVEAAQKIRQVMPTYSQAWEGIRKLRRTLTIAPFITWTGEMWRTTLGSMAEVYKETRDHDPAMRARGWSRLGTLSGAIISATGVGTYGLQLLANQDGHDEEDEAWLRKLLPEWTKNSQLLVTFIDGQRGVAKYLDMSFINPYDTVISPFRAFFLGLNDPSDRTKGGFSRFMEAGGRGLSELMDPYFNEQLLVGSLLEAFEDINKGRGEIVPPSAPKPVAAMHVLWHMGKTMEPGTLTSLRRVYRGYKGKVSPSGKKYDFGTEVMAMLGLRMTEVDLNTSFKFRAIENKNLFNQGTWQFTKQLESLGSVSSSDLEKGWVSATATRYKAARELRETLLAMEGLGVPRHKILNTLKEQRVPEEMLRMVLNNTYRDIRLSPESRREAFRAIREATERAGGVLDLDRMDAYNELRGTSAADGKPLTYE